MANLQTFKARGVIKGISDIKKTEHYMYVELRIEMQFSGQILDFHIVENLCHPNNYRVITNYFGDNAGAHKVGDVIQFDFNIIYDKRNNMKLKIWSVYNKAHHELETKN